MGMARTPSADRLTEAEAAEFRASFQRIRELKRVTNVAIAKRMGWSGPRQLTHQLEVSKQPNGKRRPIMATKGIEMLRALAELPAGEGTPFADLDKANRRLFDIWDNANWYLKWRARQRTPRVHIPTAEIQPFAEFLAQTASTSPGVGVSTKRALHKAIMRALREDAPRMALAWRQHLVGPYIFRVAKDAEEGKKLWLDDVSGSDVLTMKPSSIVNRAIRRVADDFTTTSVSRNLQPRKKGRRGT